MLGGVWMLALVACRGGEGDDPTGPGPGPGSDPSGDSTLGPTADTGSTRTVEADPDVATWVPEGWPLAEPPARVVFLGDSITAGVGATADELDYLSLLLNNDDERYPEYAGRDVSTLFGSIEAFTAGQGGATTETVIDVQLPAIADTLGDRVEGPTLVFGTIGGNDVTSVIFGLQDLGQERERIATNVDAIAAFFQDEERFPDGSMVFLTNVYEPLDGQGQAEECFFGLDLSNIREDFDLLNERTLELAQASEWSWVDLHGHFLGHGHNHDDDEGPNYDAEDPSLWMKQDCIHPNNRGHHEIRRLFMAALENESLPR
jgi:lysophospholipase L1-like esterase